MELEPDDFYYEKKKMVLTEKFHKRRGRCCGNGCRHCPYTPKHCRNVTNIANNCDKNS